MEKGEKLSIRLDVALRQKVEGLAYLRKIRKTDLIRIAVRDYFLRLDQAEQERLEHAIRLQSGLDQ